MGFCRSLTLREGEMALGGSDVIRWQLNGSRLFPGKSGLKRERESGEAD